jgi:tRNA (guanine37-N1)-methyltransferase
MRVDVLTLFPEAFAGPLDVSIIRRAREAGLLDLHLHDIRDYATDRHKSVDDYPFGGGQGMVLRVDVLVRALEAVSELDDRRPRVVYLTPQGRALDDAAARRLATCPRLALVCGRYEGVDERFIEGWVDEEISIGDFILTGGELPAMVLVDAVARHIPGALGDEASAADESFSGGLLEHPQYTRPASFRGRDVPAVLQSGDHAAIEDWRNEQRILRTARRRPDILPGGLSDRPPRKVAGARIRTGEPHEYETARTIAEDVASGSWLGAAAPPGRDRDLFIVAAEGRRIVGAAVAGWDGHEGRLYALFVVPERRRRGLGRALIRELEARLVLKGASRVALLAGSRGETAASFFAHIGWRVEQPGWLVRELSPTSAELSTRTRR